MHAASFAQSTNTISTYAKKMTRSGRPDIEIFLDNHNEGKIYTTFDALSGQVAITAPHNARFDEVQVTLEGSSKTCVENMSPATTQYRTSAYHNFLKLVMPIRESEYPQPRIAEAGRTYTFPFNFVIPDQLLPNSCSHRRQANHVHQAHLRLPPSMGDREVSVQDDLAPGMAKVQYCIKVKVIRNRERDAKAVNLTEGLRKLRIVPAVPEAPPMSILANDKDYTLSKTKSLKKGVFKGKLGHITVSALQTSAIVLPSPSSTSNPTTTMATIHLRFDPHKPTSQPPRLGGLTTKIKTTTFHSIRPVQELATRASMIADYDTTRRLYSSTVPLSSRCVESVPWTKHFASPSYTRRDSGSSTSSSDCSDNVYLEKKQNGKVNYTATILVPLTLPQSKSWIPTFHSCMVSRIYALNLSLSIHSPGTGVPASTVSLCLPIQIAAAGNGSAPGPSRPEALTEAAEAEAAAADEYLRPRVVEMPREDLMMNSVLAPASELPPSYENFAAPAQRQVVEPGRG